MIRENQIWGNNGLVAGGDGIYIDNSQFVTAENNQVNDNWNGGITCNNSSKNLLIKNSVSDNRHNGINLLSSSDYNLITQNQLSNHETDSRGAIYIENSRNNNFVFNNLTDNGCWAIQLKGNQGNNTFYGNNFIHNSYRNTRSNPGALQISTPGTSNGNNWDNGSYGNYWSDYDGSGKYFINENNIDHYPVSKQVDISSIDPIPTINTSQVQSSINSNPAFLALIGIIAALIIITLIYRRHRKNAKPS
jgi:parallel beta-helix repeat protein